MKWLSQPTILRKEDEGLRRICGRPECWSAGLRCCIVPGAQSRSRVWNGIVRNLVTEADLEIDIRYSLTGRCEEYNCARVCLDVQILLQKDLDNVTRSMYGALGRPKG